MRIQIIQHISGSTLNKNEITTSPLHAPRALDDYEINIVDLSVPRMWTNKGSCSGVIDSSNDLDTICQMVSNRKNAAVVYVMPQNTPYSYHTSYAVKGSPIPIKDILEGILKSSIIRALPSNAKNLNMLYERTKTTISGVSYDADFYFPSPKEIITQSDKSEKPTTIELAKNVYATTLNITKSSEELIHYISSLFQKKEHSAIPEWMENIEFGDDKVQKEVVKKSRKDIENAEERIRLAEEKLEENSEIKSILYTSGDELVNVVIKILERMLNCDLSNFKDEKREDFLIKLPECTFIGEIKGVSTNVRYEHISQVELHFRGYLDDLHDKNSSEDVKQLLIINPFRTKPLDQREPVHTSQIDLAVRNNCLIIETYTLLHAYEMICDGRVSTADCVKLFKEKDGLLELSDFE